MEPTVFDCKLKFPATCLVFGNSNSGKTELIFSLLKNRERVFGQPINHVYFIYTILQERFNEIANEDSTIKFIKDFSEVPDTKQEKTIIVFDDKMNDFMTNKKSKNEILDIFFRQSHHRNFFVFVTMQALFGHGIRQAVLNAPYQIIFPMLRDLKMLDYLNNQMFPEKKTFLRKVMEDVCKEKYGYLLLDCTDIHNNFRIRNFVYPVKNAKVYIPK